ncbi:MAG TPA: antibiotic biosynthesis monooxygenase family protein [Ktedonobacteraceae bacterium]|nr:antibiotic biosynthesis monooxygenase family protein [Ktedonobacteraceae bacterium]
MEKLLVFYRITVDIKQEEFEEAYRQYKPKMEYIPGHYSEMLVRSTTDANTYGILSTWQPESFLNWLESPAHAEVVDLLNTYKRGAPQISRYVVAERFDRL